MKSLLLAFSFLLFSLTAQTPTLTTALTALANPNADRTAATRQLVDAMTPLAQPDHRPSPHSVNDFAIELTRALIGKKMTAAQRISFENAIIELMRGSVPNLVSTGHLREALTGINVDAFATRALTTRALAIGEEIRGPDDRQLDK
ncbi:MAG TPA: hypothetical protein VGL72_20450 [Bryobacteraceae bacterium]|jgi:hypothetical protein